MTNSHLQDPAFWEDVEGDDLKREIAKLEAIENPSRAITNKLRKYHIKLNQVQEEAKRLAAINAKWQNGSKDRKPEPTRLEADDTARLFANSVDIPKEHGKHYCSFCACELQMISAIRGTGRIRVDRYTELIVDGDEVVDVEEKVKVMAQKVIACPQCAHLVAKPQTASRV